MKHLFSLLIAGALIAGSGTPAAVAQKPDQDSVKENAKEVGKDTKNTVKATGKVVKKKTKKSCTRPQREPGKA